jgi:hypothetical protein
MKLEFIILLFLSISVHAQNWTDWKTIDTIKCDSVKIPKVYEHRWNYGSDKTTYINNSTDSKLSYWIKEQLRIDQFGIRQRRNMIIVKHKEDYNIVEDSLNINCLKKHKK